MEGYIFLAPHPQANVRSNAVTCRTVVIGSLFTFSLLLLGVQHCWHAQQIQSLHKLVESMQGDNLQREDVLAAASERVALTWPNGGSSAYSDLHNVASHLRSLSKKVDVLHVKFNHSTAVSKELSYTVNELKQETDHVQSALFGTSTTSTSTTTGTTSAGTTSNKTSMTSTTVFCPSWCCGTCRCTDAPVPPGFCNNHYTKSWCTDTTWIWC